MSEELQEPVPEALVDEVRTRILAVNREWHTDINAHFGLATDLAVASIEAVRAYDEEHHG